MTRVNLSISAHSPLLVILLLLTTTTSTEQSNSALSHLPHPTLTNFTSKLLIRHWHWGWNTNRLLSLSAEMKVYAVYTGFVDWHYLGWYFSSNHSFSTRSPARLRCKQHCDIVAHRSVKTITSMNLHVKHTHFMSSWSDSRVNLLTFRLGPIKKRQRRSCPTL